MVSASSTCVRKSTIDLRPGPRAHELGHLVAAVAGARRGGGEEPANHAVSLVGQHLQCECKCEMAACDLLVSYRPLKSRCPARTGAG